jgi:hypothetical protein
MRRRYYKSGRDLSRDQKLGIGAVVVAVLGAFFFHRRVSAAAPSPPQPNIPVVPPVNPPIAPPLPFSRLDVGTSAARAPGPHSFQMRIGDIVSIEGTAADFGMNAPLGMLRQLNGSEGFGPVGLNDFLIVGPGALQVTYQGGSATINVL